MTIERTIIEIVAAVLRLDEQDVTPDLSRDRLDSWDSANHITLILSIEDELGVRFTEHEIPELNTVADLIAAVKRHLGGA